MWHHSNYNFTDTLFAKQLVASLETRGMKVFSNNNTTWHFDDKVGETYLLQAIDASLVPAYIFYSKSKALELAKNTNFPKVFKLRGEW
jgi:glutathione synthase/RimK-type ligase-like ATP-grasp enzyme